MQSALGEQSAPLALQYVYAVRLLPEDRQGIHRREGGVVRPRDRVAEGVIPAQGPPAEQRGPCRRGGRGVVGLVSRTCCGWKLRESSMRSNTRCCAGRR